MMNKIIRRIVDGLIVAVIGLGAYRAYQVNDMLAMWLLIIGFILAILTLYKLHKKG